MADPVLTTCTADAWTKVATNATSGTVTMVDRQSGAQLLQTYRDTGGAAPSGTPGQEAVLVKDEEIEIEASSGIDVYLYARTSAIVVRVDL